MQERLNFETLSQDILALLKQNRIKPVNFGIVLTISKNDFDILATQYPEYRHPTDKPGLILVTKSDSTQWFVQIGRQMDKEDFREITSKLSLEE